MGWGSPQSGVILSIEEPVWRQEKHSIAWSTRFPSGTTDAIRRAQAKAPPADEARGLARIFSPRLVHPGQAADFEKEVLEVPSDADV